MKLKELDAWYKENEIPLDDFFRSRKIVWNSLSYESKVKVYDDSIAFDKKEKEAASYASRAYHKRPDVTDYFKRNKLNHVSGDYRPLKKKLLYPLFVVFYRLTKNNSIKAFLKLCELNNLHGQKK